MDLVANNKKAILFPTKNQTEQEYLSKYFKRCKENKKYYKNVEMTKCHLYHDRLRRIVIFDCFCIIHKYRNHDKRYDYRGKRTKYQCDTQTTKNWIFC